jgi:thiamine-phosphate pyrophosphorylase
MAARTRGRGVVDVVARMLDGIDAAAGAIAIVVREKAALERDVARLCAALQSIAQRAQASVLVHTHAALVGSLGLRGVHLDGNAGADAVRAARLRMPGGTLVGLSRHAHDIDAATGALVAHGADYATLSPIFSPSSKARDLREPLGPEALVGHALPVFALGGIDPPAARRCVDVGAAGVAVLGGVMGARDPRSALAALLAATTHTSR